MSIPEQAERVAQTVRQLAVDVGAALTSPVGQIRINRYKIDPGICFWAVDYFHGDGGLQSSPFASFADAFTAARELETEQGCEVKSAATYFLEICTRRKTLNRRRSSYGWKHIAEGATREYIANEELIEAARNLGFTVQMIAGSPNAYLNISEGAAHLNGGRP